MNDNKVIDLKSRKPLGQKIAEEAKTAEEMADLSRQAHLQAVDHLRNLVEKGEVEGLVLIGKHVKTGFFYHDCVFPMREGTAGCTPQEALTYTGFLETVKIQFADLAGWAPCVLPDGTIHDFEAEIEEIEE